MKYELLPRDYSRIHDEKTRLMYLELDFFATRMVENIFRLMEFAGIPFPEGIAPTERVFLFHDETLDCSYYVEATLGDDGILSYFFVTRNYFHAVYVSYSNLFRLKK